MNHLLHKQEEKQTEHTFAADTIVDITTRKQERDDMVQNDV